MIPAGVDLARNIKSVIILIKSTLDQLRDISMKKILVSLFTWVNSHNLVLIFITIYFLISVIKIEHPGVNNDQLMFVNAATFNSDNFFLWKSFNGLPIMVFPYIGALKSYIYMPIFYLFGVNILSIRLPHIIIISISLFILYKTLRGFFDKKTALICVLFLSLDPSLISYSRADNGPTVLEFFLKILSIYLLSLYLKTKNIYYFLGIYIILALGIFNKINFIWFANSLIISFLIIYGKTFHNNLKHFGRFISLLLIGFPTYFLLRFFFKLSRETALSYKHFTSEVSLINIIRNFPIFISNLSDLTNGTLFYQTIYGYDPTPLGILFSLLILIIVLAGAILIFKQSNHFRFLTLVVILISLQILLTKRAVSAWHILVLSPFPTILLSIGYVKIYSFCKNIHLKIMLTFLIIFLATYQLVVNGLYLIKYSQPTKLIAWSSAIYPLINYTKNYPVKFVCLDVDICNQLLSFNQETEKYIEPFSFLDAHTYGATLVNLSKNFKKTDEYLYIAHADENSHFISAKLEFLKFLRDSNINYRIIKDFKDGETVIFEIYKLNI